MTESDPAQRLEALRRYAILDTPAEQDFDQLAHLAGTICNAPVALVSLVEENRQWFKARRGLDISETPISQSVCARVMHEPGPVQIPDLREDARSSCNTLVTAGPQFRFYAGAPLRTAQGITLGMLCVLDYVPRVLDETQLRALEVLAQQVVTQMEARRIAALLALETSRQAAALRQAQDARAELQRVLEEHTFVVDHVLAGLVVHAGDGSLLFANDMACEFLGLTRDQLAGRLPADAA